MSKFNCKRLIPAIFVISLFFAFASATQADDIMFGVRGGAYFDASAAFIGGELLLPVFNDSWFFNPNVEYVFVDPGNLETFNFDFHYDFPVNGPYYIWAGAGPAIIHNDPGGRRASDTDFGVNLIFGVGFRIRHSNIVPYIQPKIILADNSEFSLGFGVRF